MVTRVQESVATALRRVLIIFDADDTLLTTHDALIAARTRVLKEAFGLVDWSAAMLEAAHRAWTRASWFVAPDDCRAALEIVRLELGGVDFREGFDPDDVCIRRLYEDVEIAKCEWHPEALRIMEELHAGGCVLAVLTNGEEEKQQRKLVKIERSGYVKPPMTLILPQPGLRPKPCADGVLELCKRAQVAPQKAVVVGDRTTDVIAAHLAEAMSILVMHDSIVTSLPSTSGRLGAEVPSLAVPSLREVPDAVRMVISHRAERICGNE